MALNIRHGVQSAPASSFDLPLVPWEGGPAYWAQFAKASAAGWTSASFFPIAIFLGKSSGTHPAQLASLGINVYMNAEHQPPISNVTVQNLFVIAQSPASIAEWTLAEIGTNPNVVGWFIYDECEQGEGACGAFPTDAQRLAQFTTWCNTTRAYADGRFLFANFGNGVLNSFWAPGTMNQWMSKIDGCAVDKYAYTSPGVDFEIGRSPDWPGTEPQAKTSAAYGWMMDQMRGFDSTNPTRRPIWGFFETQMPYLGEAGRLIITYAQLEGAVFSALANESRGISYFQHNGFYDAQNGGPPTTDPNTGLPPNQATYSLVDGDTSLKAAVTSINTRVRALAPVLNTQSYVWNFSATGIDTMLKVSGGFAYIFASVGLAGTTGSKTFTLPSGINGTTVTVVDESRTLSVTSGHFTDSFAAEYSHHTYRIAM